MCWLVSRVCYAWLEPFPSYCLIPRKHNVDLFSRTALCFSEVMLLKSCLFLRTLRFKLLTLLLQPGDSEMCKKIIKGLLSITQIGTLRFSWTKMSGLYTIEILLFKFFMIFYLWVNLNYGCYFIIQKLVSVLYQLKLFKPNSF